jgi:hypothetical protein
MSLAGMLLSTGTGFLWKQLLRAMRLAEPAATGYTDVRHRGQFRYTNVGQPDGPDARAIGASGGPAR